MSCSSQDDLVGELVTVFKCDWTQIKKCLQIACCVKDNWKTHSKAAGQTDLGVDAGLQNQNLRTDLRWVAKRIRKSQKVVNWTCDQLSVSTRLALGQWSNAEKPAWTCLRKPTQAGGQTKRKLNASRNLHWRWQGTCTLSTIRANSLKWNNNNNNNLDSKLPITRQQ